MAEAIFEGYDRAGLDAQYNNLATCPASGEILERYRASSAAAQSGVTWPDVQWGADRRESLDVYLPSGVSDPPVVVFFHGGAWLALDKESSAFAAPAFTGAGAAFVALGFHTAASVPFPEMVRRVREGIAWMLGHASEYGCGTNRMVLVGHSSGAHLVSQCLTYDWTAVGFRSDPFAGAVLISGLCDLEPVRKSYRNDRLRLTMQDVIDYSLKHNAVSARCAVDVFVSALDTSEFRRQSTEMAQLLRCQGVLRKSVELPGRNHFDIALDLADTGSTLFNSVCSLAFAESFVPSGGCHV